MMNVALQSHLRPLAPRIDDVSLFLQAFRGTSAVAIASIGPSGTSADAVCRALETASPNGSSVQVRPVLCATFPAVMDAVLSGDVDFALVPSAYRDATAFHWHTQLMLAAAFVHTTPTYGLAMRPSDRTQCSDAVVVAGMSETKDLFAQLVPPELAGVPVVHRPAASTSDAARAVAAGFADLALCNDLGRAESGLIWVTQRPGTEIVWMLFCSRNAFGPTSIIDLMKT